MNAEKREMIISWLESNRSNGFFNGQIEEEMDFNSLDNESIEWYYENWAYDDMNEEEEID